MKNKRVVIWVLVVTLLMALPTVVLARKQVYKATLLGQIARGSAVMITAPNGLPYMVFASRLSEQPTSVNLHLPSGEAVATLCVGATCTMSDGFLNISGTLTAANISMPIRDFMAALNGGLLTIQIHTSQGVEASGALIPQ